MGWSEIYKHAPGTGKPPIVWTLKKKWNIRYDDTWREIHVEAAKRSGMPVEDVERINTAWWKFVGEMMCRVDLPRIRMMYLLTLSASMRKLSRYCDLMSEGVEKLAHGIRSRRSTGDVGAMKKHMMKLHDTYFRLVKEEGMKRKVGVVHRKKAEVPGKWRGGERK